MPPEPGSASTAFNVSQMAVSISFFVKSWFSKHFKPSSMVVCTSEHTTDSMACPNSARPTFAHVTRASCSFTLAQERASASTAAKSEGVMISCSRGL